MATRPGSTPQPVYASGLAGDRRTVDEMLALIRRPSWQADAACIEHPEVNFYPERGESTEPARAVCSGCLVRAECLDFSLQEGNGGRFGVWGGTSARERRRISTTRRSAA